MFLTKLVLNPTHPQARCDLANAYELHRSLSRVYATRPDSPPPRFLWRLEHTSRYLSPETGATVLLQCATPGNWHRLQEIPGYVRALHPDKQVPVEQLLHPGRSLVFRLRCNPTVTRGGKRYGLKREDEQLAWLTRQGQRLGFLPLNCRISRNEQVSYRAGRGDRRITLQIVQFDGLLRVEEPQTLGQALVDGIGHGKALGLGMLSLAPARS